MSKSYVIAEHNYAQDRWALCMFDAEDFRIKGGSKSVRNVVKAEYHAKSGTVCDRQGRTYKVHSDRSLTEVVPDLV